MEQKVFSKIQILFHRNGTYISKYKMVSLKMSKSTFLKNLGMKEIFCFETCFIIIHEIKISFRNKFEYSNSSDFFFLSKENNSIGRKIMNNFKKIFFQQFNLKSFKHFQIFYLEFFLN